MKNLDKKNMPIHLIVLSLLFIFPLGVYYIVLRTSEKLHNIKKVASIFKCVGFLGIIIGVIYFLCNYSTYVSLIDSHMNLDMYSFNFIYIYMYIIMIVVSSFVGFFKLNNKCEKLIIYTEFINIRHIKDIDVISEETFETIDEVKENINKLIDLGYLINVKVDGEQLVSTKTVDKNNLVRCKTCGNIEKLLDNNVNCSFCMRKLSKKDRM
jgi:hypothetical protein